MASTQELIVQEEAIEPPRKMIARPRYFMNKSIHEMAELTSQQLFAGILAQSNNDGGSCATADVKEFKEFWQSVKDVAIFLKEVHTAREGYDPAPDGELDRQVAVLMPSASEKARYKNNCWKRPHHSLFKFLDILSSHSDIDLASEIKDWDLIDRAMIAVDKSIEYYFDGKIKFPSRQKLKNMSPPADFDYEKSYEASADNPETGFKDQPDTEVAFK